MKTRKERLLTFLLVTVFVGGVGGWGVAGYNTAHTQNTTRIEQLDTRVNRAERTLVTLHTCFPNGYYQADAAPTCPAFKEWLTGELNKNEPTFTEENDNADRN